MKSLNSAEEIPNTAIFLKRTALEFLQAIFHSRGDKDPFYYDQVDSESKIQITDQHAVDLEGTHFRPGIVAVRGALSSSAPMGLGGNQLESVSRLNGVQTFNTLLTGSIAFSCISREGYEAEQIAHILFNSFKFFAPVLRKEGFFSIKSLNIGGEILVVQEGDHDDLYMVPVYITADIQDRWTLSPDAERKLRSIIIEEVSKN